MVPDTMISMLLGPLFSKPDKASLGLKKLQKPWNAGRCIGQKRPLTRDQISRLKLALKVSGEQRDLALFSMAIDSMLRASDLLALSVSDVAATNGKIKETVKVHQQKTGRTVQFVISKSTASILKSWLVKRSRAKDGPLFRGAKPDKPLTQRQYHRLVKRWVKSIGLEPEEYGTHSLRRTKATIIYAETLNVEIVRILLGQSSITSTTYYLGISENEALDTARSTIV